MSATSILTALHTVWFNQAMAATLGPTNVPIDHIIEFNAGYTFQQNGSTAPTLADIKGDFIDELVLALSGREICRLDWYDVCILQNLWFGQTPHHLIPANDDSYGYWSPITLPLLIDKAAAGGKMRSFDVSLTVGALTDIDNLVIQANFPYLTNRIVSDGSILPKGYHYAYQYRTFTAQTTPQRIVFDRKGADLIGLMVYSCTIPTASSLNTSVDWLRIYVNSQPVYGPIYWEAIPTFKTTQNVLDDTGYGAELDNYRYIDLRRAPLPADDLDIETQSVGATDAGQKIIGVFQEL